MSHLPQKTIIQKEIQPLRELIFRGTNFECKCATRRHKHNSLLDPNHYLVAAEKLFCDICLSRRVMRFGETYKIDFFK